VLPILVSSIPSYYAWQYSPHEAGTTKDADFMSLIQSCIVSFSSLITIAISLRKDPDFTGERRWWGWAAVISALILLPVAIICYLYVPTEFSSLLVNISGYLQAFLTFQLAMTVEEKPKAKLN